MLTDERICKRVLSLLEGRDGEIVSTALIEEKVENQGQTTLTESEIDVQEAVQELILLGEITLVWAQQYGRVRLSRSVTPDEYITDPESELVWRAYIARDYENWYCTGLFSSKQAAEDYLRGVAGDTVDDLEQVPELNSVYAIQMPGFDGLHTVVVRCEEIRDELRLEE